MHARLLLPHERTSEETTPDSRVVARLARAAPPRVIQRTHLEGREGRQPSLHYYEGRSNVWRYGLFLSCTSHITRTSPANFTPLPRIPRISVNSNAKPGISARNSDSSAELQIPRTSAEFHVFRRIPSPAQKKGELHVRYSYLLVFLLVRGRVGKVVLVHGRALAMAMAHTRPLLAPACARCLFLPELEATYVPLLPVRDLTRGQSTGAD